MSRPSPSLRYSVRRAGGQRNLRQVKFGCVARFPSVQPLQAVHDPYRMPV
jgi:hypothetical protein